MIDEVYIRQYLTERLEEGETLLYLSLPGKTLQSFPFFEVVKGAVFAAVISLMVFFAIWAKHHTIEVARNCAVWGYLVFLVVLLVHSIFFYRQNSRIISAITDRAILRLDYKGALSNLNAVNSKATGEICLHRVPFDTIESVTVFESTDKSGDMLYSLKGPGTKKPVENIRVYDIELALEAMPKTLNVDSCLSKRRLGGHFR